MRKIIVTEFITLDGVIEAPSGKEFGLKHSRAVDNGVLILEFQPIS
jgi:hypothetical protein